MADGGYNKADASETKRSDLPKTGVKVYYWPATGRAQLIRYMLAEAGVDWEDVCFEPDPKVGRVYDNLIGHFSTEPFLTFKKQCREKGGNFTNNLPMLEVEGKFYTQSIAVYKYVARRTGLYPSNAEDAYVVDNIVQHCEDAMTQAYDLHFGKTTKDNFVNEIIPAHLGNLERLTPDKDFFVPGSFTLADLIVFDLVSNKYVAQIPDVLKNYPKLAGLIDRVGNRENLKAYRSSERCTKMDGIRPPV